MIFSLVSFMHYDLGFFDHEAIDDPSVASDHRENFAPSTTLASNSSPRSHRQLRSAHSSSLKTWQAARRESDTPWCDRSDAAPWRSSTR